MIDWLILFTLRGKPEKAAIAYLAGDLNMYTIKYPETWLQKCTLLGKNKDPSPDVTKTISPLSS